MKRRSYQEAEIRSEVSETPTKWQLTFQRMILPAQTINLYMSKQILEATFKEVIDNGRDVVEDFVKAIKTRKGKIYLTALDDADCPIYKHEFGGLSLEKHSYRYGQTFASRLDVSIKFETHQKEIYI